MDAADPTAVLARATEPFLRIDPAEAQGQVGNVCFAEGLVAFKGVWRLYVGLADLASARRHGAHGPMTDEETILQVSDPERHGLSSEGLARIDEWLSGLIAQRVLPGAATLIARHGRVIHRSALGLKNMARGEPLAEDTIYAIFSMTKPVTAVAMMILHEQGLWSPEDPIAKHLPEFESVRGPDGGAPDHAPAMRELR